MAGGVDYFTHCDSRGRHDLWFGEEERADEGYLTDLISRPCGGLRRAHGRRRQSRHAVLSQPALHRAALALGDARRRSAGAGGQGQPVPPARRQHPHLPPHDPPHGRRHRPGDGGAANGTGLADNTLVVFTSDNGGERFSDNWPLVGGKMDLTEGGIRVPWIAHWPAAIAPGRRERAAMHDDGLVGHDAGRGRCAGRCGAIRWTASRCCRCCAMPATAFAGPCTGA